MSFWLWAGFVGLLLFLVAADLGVFHRKPHVVSTAEALGWTAFWISLALAFNASLFYLYGEAAGAQAALQFFTGYLVEKSLSLDNILVIALIFAHFRVGAADQHRLLVWGVLGHLVLRALMITIGVTLIERVGWSVYVFGAFLILTAVKVLVVRHDNLEPERNLLVRLARRAMPWAATPLVLSLLMIGSADLLFAIDSIPAILAVTRDPFLVFTSNAFAVLGLRSLYFVLASWMDRIRYLNVSLAFLLAFVGVKMLLSHYHTIPTEVTLAVIGTSLAVGIAASFLDRRAPGAPLSPLEAELSELARMTYRNARRVVILAFGSTVLLIGAALLVLPGPGIPLLLLGLAILATEFVWARALLKRARSEADRLAKATRRVLDRR